MRLKPFNRNYGECHASRYIKKVLFTVMCAEIYVGFLPRIHVIKTHCVLTNNADQLSVTHKRLEETY